MVISVLLEAKYWNITVGLTSVEIKNCIIWLKMMGQTNSKRFANDSGDKQQYYYLKHIIEKLANKFVLDFPQGFPHFIPFPKDHAMSL